MEKPLEHFKQTIEQNSSKEETMKKEHSEEIGESLRSVIQLLKETSEKFNLLRNEARALLYTEKDTSKEKEKLQERTQQIIDLPDKLKPLLQNLDSTTRGEILEKVSMYAGEAKEALKNVNYFAMGVLLKPRGSKTDDPNDLDLLIQSLEQK